MGGALKRGMLGEDAVLTIRQALQRIGVDARILRPANDLERFFDGLGIADELAVLHQKPRE